MVSLSAKRRRRIVCARASSRTSPLCGLLVLGHGRRRILWLGVTAHPTAEWIAQQVTEAFGWESAPQYLIRDRDRIYGETFIRRIRAMGIRDRPTTPRSLLCSILRRRPNALAKD